MATPNPEALFTLSAEPHSGTETSSFLRRLSLSLFKLELFCRMCGDTQGFAIQINYL